MPNAHLTKRSFRLFEISVCAFFVFQRHGPSIVVLQVSNDKEDVHDDDNDLKMEWNQANIDFLIGRGSNPYCRSTARGQPTTRSEFAETRSPSSTSSWPRSSATSQLKATLNCFPGKAVLLGGCSSIRRGADPLALPRSVPTFPSFASMPPCRSRIV